MPYPNEKVRKGKKKENIREDSQQQREGRERYVLSCTRIRLRSIGDRRVGVWDPGRERESWRNGVDAANEYNTGGEGLGSVANSPSTARSSQSDLTRFGGSGQSQGRSGLHNARGEIDGKAKR